MALRLVPLVSLATFLFIGIVRADSSPTFIGSSINSEDAVAKSEAIFVGKVINVGFAVMAYPDESSDATTKIKVLKILKGSVADPIIVRLSRYNPEHALKVGDAYIFFVTKSGKNPDPYPFTVLKLLPATNDIATTVNKLISK